MEELPQRLMRYQQIGIGFVHGVLVALAYCLAFVLRFDFVPSAGQWQRFLETLPFLLVIKLLVFARFRLFYDLWSYVSMRDMLTMLKAQTLSSLSFATGVLIIFGHGFPRSVLVLDWVLCTALLAGVRVSARLLEEWTHRHRKTEGRRALVVGAGSAGAMLVREIERNPSLPYEVMGFVDDNPRKRRGRVHGYEVMGSIEALPDLCRTKGVQEILVAIPSATKDERRRVIEWCRKSRVAFKTVPALSELLHGTARLMQLHEVEPEDLLQRERVRLDLDCLRNELKGKRILVTGAGGSIGGELCRQLAGFEPALLLLFDRAESSLYFTQRELADTFPSLELVSIVGDVRERQHVLEIIRRYRPTIIYHAAAYKHVPLMEEQPLEAIANNVVGTKVVATVAQQEGVEKFVFISTDKAVQPVGIMGMTKRVAEGVVLALNGGRAAFLAVRFGNVLASNGSVLPLFKWQIGRGAPLTVTDPEATRYFMLLSEAAQLVLQAGAMGRGGEIFFLDMGEPVKIMDLAHNLIRSSGLQPDRDVPINLIGLRAGERLSEELLGEQEELGTSGHEKIWVVQKPTFERESFLRDLEGLLEVLSQRDREKALHHLEEMASRY